MFYKLSQLIIRPSKNAATASEIYVSEPSHEQEDLGGKLFIMIEFESDRGWDIRIIDFLIDSIHKSYYNSDKFLIRERVQILKTEHIFETALTKVNKDFDDFIKNEKIPISPENINITAGIIFEDKIHFANTGKNKVFLIYKTNSEPEEYKIVDIVKQSRGNEPVGEVKKLFSNVISGEIPKKSNFFITNEALPEYISEKQLAQIVSTLPPVGAVEQIKNTLVKINSYITFLGILIKNTTIDPLPKEQIQRTNTHESIINLNRTEETTEKILAPSGIIDTKKIQSKIPTIVLSRKPEKQSVLTLKDKILTKRKASFLVRKFGNIFSILGSVIIGIIRHNPLGKVFAKKTDDTMSMGKNKLLSTKSKLLLAASLCFILLFIFNVNRIENKKQAEEKIKQEADLIVLIEQKHNQAESSLLYGNDKKAGELFAEMEELMKKMPQNTEEQKTKYAELDAQLKTQLERIRKVSRIDSPEELADFSKLNVQAAPSNIILSNGKIYAGDGGQKSIYILDTANNGATAASISENISNLDSPVNIDDKAILYFNGAGITKINLTDNKTSSMEIEKLNENGRMAGADAYNNKFYFQSTEKNQIYRYNITETSLSGPTPWIQGEVDISATTDITIDGSIYLLKNNGEIMKFLKGAKENFVMGAIEPPLSNTNKIFATQENKHLYILESNTGRLVVFDKDGKFIIQYQSPKFDNLKDFAVDEKKKLMYFLNGAKILRAPIAH